MNEKIVESEVSPYAEKASLRPEETANAKKPYRTPELTVHGKVEKLTLQTSGPIPA